MILAEPIRITHRIARELERLNIRYLVGGSLASSLHGVPRATQDVDMVAEISSEHIPMLVKALESEFYTDAEMIKDAIQHRSSFNVIHLATMFKVDIFILKADNASQEEMARREQYQVTDDSEHTLFLATAEGVIAHKLYGYQLSGGISERQWRDVLGVLRVQQERIDRRYLERVARHRRVSDLLKKAFREVELGAA